MTAKEFKKEFENIIKRINKMHDYFDLKVVVEFNYNGYAEAEGFDPYNVTVKYFEDDEEMDEYEVYAFESASPAQTHKVSKDIEKHFAKLVETEWVKQNLL